MQTFRLIVFLTFLLFAATPPAAASASCPAGYVEADTDRLVVSDGACPAGTTSIDSARLLPASESACDEKGCYTKTCTYEQ
jgi:hypothetical protein